jgi:SAM-dependent methyltransferase
MNQLQTQTALSLETLGESDVPEAARKLDLALPIHLDEMSQDEEWCVVNSGDGWQRVRLHDYHEVYSVPGLYEKWIYEICGCRSPQHIARLMRIVIGASHADPASMSVLDLGAGNGFVAQELAKLGMKDFVGVDLIDEAKTAAERDRPGLYKDYIVCDLTDLTKEQRTQLGSHTYNCLACVAALGFGDIPARAFAEAYNLVEDGGLIAFTIKPDFLDPSDQSGFSRMIRGLIDHGTMQLLVNEHYDHRLASHDGQKIRYAAIVGIKKRNIAESELADD